MKPHQLVPKRETCLQMKAAGFEQGDCAYYWVETFSNPLPLQLIRDMQIYHSRIAAPTLQEILNVMTEYEFTAEAAALLWLELNEVPA